MEKSGRLVKGTEETKRRMAELRALKAIKKQKTNQHMAELRAIKQQKKISATANQPMEKPKKHTLKPM